MKMIDAIFIHLIEALRGRRVVSRIWMMFLLIFEEVGRRAILRLYWQKFQS